MRLATVRPIGTASDGRDGRVAVVLDGGRILTLEALADGPGAGLAVELARLDMAGLLAADPDLERVRAALAAATARDPKILAGMALDPASVRLASPVPRPGKAIGVGYNYLDHVREQGRERPARPVLFSMFANAVVGDGDPIRRPAGTHALDLEAEMAVVIGRQARGVGVEGALRCVAGYTAANDATARDWQGQEKALRPGEKGDGQWLRAKGSDTFLPLGPVMVTADELGDGRGLAVRSWVTAVSGPRAGTPFQMQSGNTADLMFGVAELVAMISAEVTLDPGDVIVTGTPSGVGVFRDPPVFLDPGDLVRVEVERIGSLTSPIVDERGAAAAESPAGRFLAARS